MGEVTPARLKYYKMQGVGEYFCQSALTKSSLGECDCEGFELWRRVEAGAW